MVIGVQIDQTLTDKMIEQAVLDCAEAHFAGDSRRMRQALLQGQCEHCCCVNESLVRQISEYLGKIDRTVKAVYQFGSEISAQAGQGGEARSFGEKSGIHLIAWVDRKSAAFNALAETLETVLSASQRAIGCANAVPSCFTLDIEMVDDSDVRERRGFGLLVDASPVQARLAWKRPSQQETLVPQETGEIGRVRFTLPYSFDPELIPEARLIEHAQAIERMPPEERGALDHHLTELKVILIRRMLSDQLSYIDIAKRWLTTTDLVNILHRRIGYGRVGGKSAGMLLAARILDDVGDEDIRACVQIPESYFLGSELIYIFMAMNGLMYWNDQKYKPEEQVWAEYPQVQQEFQAGKFPPEILAELKELLLRVGNKPLIVRSSSQLEDNFGTSFAGKYDSFFCPNQGTTDENLNALTKAIARTYASTLKPEALLYRRSKGLQDYDERMAVLIQVVQGDSFGSYFLPHGAGVAFSHNLYRWSPQIRREDGFVRLVWGLGTRAVERVGNDYPRLIALSHPLLQPDDSVAAILSYSQRYVDLIDLEENSCKTLPVHQVLSPRYPALRYLAQLEQDGYITTPHTRILEADIPKLVITYHELLRRTPFASLIFRIMRLLEQHYHSAVDIEFTLQITNPQSAQPGVQISLLQCRPQSHFTESEMIAIPKGLASEDIIFSTSFMVPRGYLEEIRYVLFIPPEGYFGLGDSAERRELGRLVGRLNAALVKHPFICIGPGRWGTTNPDLGIYVSYSDIYNASALVELTGQGIGSGPEPSLGTHFFQDLMEAQIYPLAICLGEEGVEFNRDFFYNPPNCVDHWIEISEKLKESVRLIEVASYRPGHHLELVMDDERGKAVAFLAPDRA